MLTKIDMSDILLCSEGLVIRRIEEKDRDTFSKYTSIGHFEEALCAKDTLGIFKDGEMVGAFICYDRSENGTISEMKSRDTALGYSCKPSQRNMGILSKALTMLSDRLLTEVDHVFLEINEDNTASMHVARNAGFTEFSRNEKMACFSKPSLL